MAKSGSILEYRIELVKRIGQDKVDWLEGKHEPKRYTIEDLKAIKAEYRAKVRELKKSNQEEKA
ncbi:Bacteriophage Lambda NinG protein [compost metagenome]